MIKTILQTTVPYTTILKNQLHKALDAIIVENQSAAIKKNRRIGTLSTIRDIIDVSKPLIELIRIFSFLLCKSRDVETKSFT